MEFSFNLTPQGGERLEHEDLVVGAPCLIDTGKLRFTGTLIEAWELDDGCWYVRLDLSDVEEQRIRAQLEEHGIDFKR